MSADSSEPIKQNLIGPIVTEGWQRHRHALTGILLALLEKNKDGDTLDPKGNKRIFQIGERRYSLAEVTGSISGRPPVRSESNFTYANIGLKVGVLEGAASRSEIDTTLDFMGLKLQFPIVSNMTSVVSDKLIEEVSRLGGVVCDTRAISVEDQEAKLVKYRQWKENEVEFIPTVGASNDSSLDYCKQYAELGCKIILIDTAHGGVRDVVWNFTAECLVSQELANTKFIVGNFGNVDQVKQFLNYLVKQTGFSLSQILDRVGVKVGIGPGAGCTTRGQTGVIEPQASAIAGVAQIPGLNIVADGGFQSGEGRPGNRSWENFFKCMALSSHPNTIITPMIGRTVAGVEESAPKKILDPNTYKLYKLFWGDASPRGKQRMGKEENSHIEGKVGRIVYAGYVKDLVQAYQQAMRSCLSYVGAKNMQEFHSKVAVQFLPPSIEKESRTRI